MPEDAVAQVQGLSLHGMSEVHVSKKLAVPDLNLRSHARCCLHIFSVALIVDERRIQPECVYVTDCGYVIVDERIALRDPD